MVNYLIRRFFQMIIVVFLSTLAIYVMLNITPGGPLSGLNITADRTSRITEEGIARLENYLGLDKPLALRYIVWLVGDDWLGSNWIHIGLRPYEYQLTDTSGELRYDREGNPMMASARFWTDPGTALLKPSYTLYVSGEETADGSIDAELIYVKQLPEDAGIQQDYFVGNVSENRNGELTLRNRNGHLFQVNTSENTAFIFPQGEGTPRPENGHWMNISWLTGANGLLGYYSKFNGVRAGILRLDFGTSWSLQRGQSVMEILQSRLGNTILLMTTASVLAIVVAIPIGIYSAVNQYSKIDYAVTTFSFFGSAMPVFWFGLMMILLFSLTFREWGLPFLPTGGTQLVRDPVVNQPGSLLALLQAEPGSLIDRIVHIIMPALVLSLLQMAGWSRFMRASMLEVLRMDYVRTARAKGLLERVVILKHSARNALIPIVTIIVFEIPNIFGGAILTETIFKYPGMGQLYFDALGASDWPIVMVILFISAILVVIATLIRDVLYTFVDPRIKLA